MSLAEPYARQLATEACRGLLGREPDENGLARWIGFLTTRGDYAGLLGQLVESEEFRSRTAAAPRIAVFGNCQAAGLARSIQALTGGALPSWIFMPGELHGKIGSGEVDLAPVLDHHDILLMQRHASEALLRRHPQIKHKTALFPVISFNAFHPDMVLVRSARTGAYLDGPMGQYHSSLALLAWRSGLDVDAAVRLFNADTYRCLGFFEYWPVAARALLAEGDAAGLALGPVLEKWRRGGCFMHSLLHPRLGAIADLARVLLHRQGLATLPLNVPDYVYDDLAEGPTWPVYPEIAEALGVEGSHLFWPGTSKAPGSRLVRVLQLPEFLERSFAAFAPHDPQDLACGRLRSEPYRELAQQLQGRSNVPAPAAPAAPAASAGTVNPYRGLPGHCFWREAVAAVPAGEVDPVLRSKFPVDSGMQVATAGSCFAQHISRTLERRGFSYLVTEAPPAALSPEEARQSGYGVFSARYGNLYTARQLLQLLQRAYGEFVPADSAWVRADGRFVDPFRPQIEAQGHASAAEVEHARVGHLAAVRRMFETMDLFIFTLGLTEAWRSRKDGAVFPLAPGVAAGAMDPACYEFVNFSAAEVAADLQNFLGGLSRHNPRARVILTVSPVPLAATYEDRHVLVSNSYSKSALRVAAGELARSHPRCDYFPSYEIVCGNHSRGAYYDTDLRSVTAAGVDHVMRLFLRHYAPGAAALEQDGALQAEAEANFKVVCEELQLAGPGG
jgi:hypothetical protein